RLIERDALAIHRNTARTEEIGDVLRRDGTEELAFLGRLAPLLVDESLDLRAQRFRVGLDAIGLRVLLPLDVFEILEIAGRGGQPKLLGYQEVARVAIGDVAHLAPSPDLRDVVEQDDFHGLSSPPPGTAARRRCAPA